MLVNYCDLCGVPLKSNNFFSLYCCSPDSCAPDMNKYDNSDDYWKDYARYIVQLRREVKEVCPSCKHIFDKVFEYRLNAMMKLTDECADLFNLPPKEDRKKKPKEGNH